MSGTQDRDDACVFLGPSLGADAPRGVAIYPPARLGSVWQAVERGHRRIALIDGVFGAQPAVWHKEILHALSRGCTVIGGSSMGALRAAELAPMGMIGIGAVYRLYRSGFLVSDADVALAHGDGEMGHRELTIPLVDLRFTLRRLRRAGRLTAGQEARALESIGAIHFARRSWAEIEAALAGADLPGDLATGLRRARVFAKARDAALVLRALREPCVASPPPRWRFPRTTFWQHQFELERESIPTLPAPVVH